MSEVMRPEVVGNWEWTASPLVWIAAACLFLWCARARWRDASFHGLYPADGWKAVAVLCAAVLVGVGVLVAVAVAGGWAVQGVGGWLFGSSAAAGLVERVARVAWHVGRSIVMVGVGIGLWMALVGALGGRSGGGGYSRERRRAEKRASDRQMRFSKYGRRE